jgi:hypothetical protein
MMVSASIQLVHPNFSTTPVAGVTMPAAIHVIGERQEGWTSSLENRSFEVGGW